MFYFSEVPDALVFDSCPECFSEDIVVNTSKDYILFCEECKKFCKFLPPDID
jgi:hypothetical protein